MGRFKDKIVSLLKTKATGNDIKLTRAMNVYKDKEIIKASQGQAIRDIVNQKCM